MAAAAAAMGSDSMPMTLTPTNTSRCSNICVCGNRNSIRLRRRGDNASIKCIIWGAYDLNRAHCWRSTHNNDNCSEFPDTNETSSGKNCSHRTVPVRHWKWIWNACCRHHQWVLAYTASKRLIVTLIVSLILFQHKHDCSHPKTSRRIRGENIENYRKFARRKSPKEKTKFVKIIGNWPPSSTRWICIFNSMRVNHVVKLIRGDIFHFHFSRIYSDVYLRGKRICRTAWPLRVSC